MQEMAQVFCAAESVLAMINAGINKYEHHHSYDKRIYALFLYQRRFYCKLLFVIHYLENNQQQVYALYCFQRSAYIFSKLKIYIFPMEAAIS